jgi:heterodisulfide reductase subunit C
LIDTVQTRDEEKIEELLKGEMIWYCAECMSCKTRCPRGNAPGLLVTALRSLSQEMGYFIESEKGRQQLTIKRTVGEWILKYGYCIHIEGVTPENHPEQGPVWEWELQNLTYVMKRMGANYKGSGPGILRKIPQESLDEIYRIFELTGALERFEKIEEYSKQKAQEMNMEIDDTMDNEYLNHLYTANNEKHFKHENRG